MNASAEKEKARLIEIPLYFGGKEAVTMSASSLVNAGRTDMALQFIVGHAYSEMREGKFADATTTLENGFAFVQDKLKDDEGKLGHIKYLGTKGSWGFAFYKRTDLALQLRDHTLELLGEMSENEQQDMGLIFKYFITDGRRSITYDSNGPASEILDALAKQLPDYDKTSKWYLNFSKLWYGRAEQGNEYLKIGNTKASQDYSKAMHEAEMDCISRNLDTIASFIESKAEYLDLGSGDAKKTIIIVSALRKTGKNVTLNLIDINKKEQETATENAEKAGIPSKPIVADFELPDSFLEKIGPGQRVFNLGATYVNYDPDYISQILSCAMQPNDIVYISAQLSRNHNDKKLVRQYSSEDIVNFAFGTLESIGFKPENVEPKTEFNKQKHQVEIWFRVLEIPKDTGVQVREIGIKPGDEVLIIVSRKPTLEEFRQETSKYFDGRIITSEDGSYAGFIGRKKGSLAQSARQ